MGKNIRHRLVQMMRKGMVPTEHGLEFKAQTGTDDELRYGTN